MTFRSLRPAAAALIGATALASCASGPDPETLGRLGFMVGCWESKPDANGQVNKEVWSAPQGGLMFSWATATKAGQLVSFEQTRIDLRGPHATYTASPDGQRPVVFTEPQPARGAVAIANTVTFENPQHDYPQRISYRVEKDGLAATISRMDGTRPVQYAWGRCKT